MVTLTFVFPLCQCYDLTGYWAEKTGANAPLRGGSADSSVEQAVEAWHSAGIPYDRIVVGVPFYGYTGLTTKPVTKHAMQVPINHSKPQIKGDKYDAEEADPCPGAKASYSGEFQWRAIQEEGILHNKNGWKSYWDASTETPYAYNAAKKQFVTFDDPHSLSAKAKYAKELNLQGIMLWSLDMVSSTYTQRPEKSISAVLIYSLFFWIILSGRLAPLLAQSSSRHKSMKTLYSPSITILVTALIVFYIYSIIIKEDLSTNYFTLSSLLIHKVYLVYRSF